VPAPTSFVVKNGSNIREMVSGGMPQPVSDTEAQIQAPSRHVLTGKSALLFNGLHRVNQEIHEYLVQLVRAAEDVE
jgi:hypothetical protein